MPAAPKRKGGAGPGKKPFVKATGSKANGAKSHPKKGSSGATSKGNWKGKAKAGDEDEVEEAGSGLESDLEAVSDNEDVGEVDEGADQAPVDYLGFPSVKAANGSLGNDDDDDEDGIRAAKGKKNKSGSGGFQTMGLSPNVLKGILRKGYKVPTPIQRKTIPLALEGRDVVAMARTGSGKTAAFLIPLFERLHTHTAKSGVRACVLSPTRELALQTFKFVKEIGKYTGLRACLLVGGDSMEDQFALLHSNPDILIATPGRLTHLMIEMNLNLSLCEYVVFDEADRLFEMGFSEQVTEITRRLPADRQTLLFSATLPKVLVSFAQAGLKDPVLVRLDVDTKLSEDLRLSFFHVRKVDKLPVLVHILQNKIASDQLTVVFVATKHHVEYMKELLESLRIDVAYIYGALDHAVRKIQLAKFRNGKSHVLVVTDVAARGIDIPILDNVIMYDFAPSPKLFQHRVGRVARAGRSGNAYCLVTPEEMPYLLDLHLFLGRPLKIAGDDVSGQAKYAENEDGVVGTVPEPLMGSLRDTVRELHSTNFNLEAAEKVMENAYKMYNKSRPKPSSESCLRAKELDKTVGFHPSLATLIDQSEVEATRLLSGVKQYRPRQTVFELHRTGTKVSGVAADVMKRKREVHTGAIEKHVQREAIKKAELVVMPFANKPQQPMEASTEGDVEAAFETIVDPARRKRKRDDMDPAGEPSTADKEHYIPYRPANHHRETGLGLGDSFAKQAQSEVMDMVGEEDGDMRKRKSQMKWDRVKKKYVMEQNEGKNKKIRTESGHYINASYNTKIYEEWKKKHHIGKDIESLPQLNNGRARGRGNYGKAAQAPAAGGKDKSGRKVREELKSSDQILKQRKIKERREQHLKNVRVKKAQRGGKGGRKGTKRRQ